MLPVVRLKIVQVGESVLRAEARPLTGEEILSAQIRDLIEHMRETLHDAPGVGLAAPQIGLPLQLAVIEDKAEYQTALTETELRERDREPVPFHVLANPQLKLLSIPEVLFFEGCLSLPSVTAMVPRAMRVAVDALDHEGESVHIEATGWYARVLQHEIDHLRGTLYIDRMRSRSFSSLDNYNRYWKAKSRDDLLREFGGREESHP
jgi:peptide deformylase